MNLKDILDKSKQLIGVNMYEQPTVTIPTILLKPVGKQICMYVLDMSQTQLDTTP